MKDPEEVLIETIRAFGFSDLIFESYESILFTLGLV
jgi:hypothetical protein